MDKKKGNSDGHNDNVISVEESNLKQDQKAELDEALEVYKRECLKSFSSNRSGEVIKKADFPFVLPMTEKQRENRMLDMVHQAVGHAFVSHSQVMTNTVHNAVLNSLLGGVTQGYTGPCYQQPNQMSNAPFGSNASVQSTAPVFQSATQPIQNGSVSGVTSP